MSLTRLWCSVDKAVRKIAEEANERTEKANIPDVEEKRLFYFQYIDQQIGKIKEDDGNALIQSRFKSLLKERASQLFENTNKRSLPSLVFEDDCKKEVVIETVVPTKKTKKRATSKQTDI